MVSPLRSFWSLFPLEKRAKCVWHPFWSIFKWIILAFILPSFLGLFSAPFAPFHHLQASPKPSAAPPLLLLSTACVLSPLRTLSAPFDLRKLTPYALLQLCKPSFPPLHFPLVPRASRRHDLLPLKDDSGPFHVHELTPCAPFL